ncbi:MAG: exoribonuclease, partial [Massilia sp.]|nr:exoribonuclease [Massilia sp.]
MSVKRTAYRALSKTITENDLNQATHTIPSREEILGIFRDAQSPLDAAALARALKVDPSAIEVLSRRLNAMVRDGQIHSDKVGNFELADHSGFVAGKVSAHRDGFGFVIPDEPGEDLFLSDKEMQKVLHGDRVLAKVTGTDRRGRLEGSIVEVVQRANSHVIGRLLNENGVWLIAPEDKRIGQDILVSGSPGKAKAGQIVSVELVEQPSRFKQPTGRVVEVLGDLDDPGMEIEIAVRKFGVPHIFSDAALKQANKLPDHVRDADLADRVDLRDIPMVTIDGEDARDFDDAVYCEARPGKLRLFSGGWKLYVAIADVSSYVKIGSALDNESQVRGNSVYFPERVVPMLPEQLSNGLCSLNPHVDRLAMVCEMTISKSGEMTDYCFYEAVIHSHARLTYNKVSAMLETPKVTEARQLRGEYNDVLPHLKQLYALYKVLLAARHVRGAIDFETQETRIIFGTERKIAEIRPTTRNDAHKLIEECMLAANVATAEFLKKHEIPALYRVHDGPPPERLEKLRAFLGELGLSLHKGKDGPSPKDYQALLASIKDRPDFHLIQTVMLRSLSQAVYSADNQGHFGLNYEAYTHFTSPIRRYPDLLTHRAIRSVIHSKQDTPHVRRAGAMTIPKARIYPYDEAALEQLGEQCSMSERRADVATRDVVNWLKCEFMKDRVVESFPGVITA